ncbi:hypothetical protein ACUZIR_003044 [Enterobacter asburiae]|uniref:hypothetical protein n=1 Tax=Enterobacter asburiae TaxID=61645 RepID=UPI003905BFA4
MKKECPICSSLSELSKHAHEVYYFSSFFIGSADIKIRAISEWIRLSSMLENVEISPWKHDRQSIFMCEPAVEALDSEGKHYSLYATELTRFFYTINALEETYRFVSQYYNERLNKRFKNDIRDESVKAIILFESMEKLHIPKHMPHINDNLRISFEKYCSTYNKNLNNSFKYETNHKCYGLNLVRNLRNHLAHGVIPININPNYNSTFEQWLDLYHLIRKATRVSLLYIQAFLSKYGSIFDTEIYLDSIGYYNWLEENYADSYTQGDQENESPDVTDIISQLHLDDCFGYYKFSNF